MSDDYLGFNDDYDDEYFGNFEGDENPPEDIDADKLLLAEIMHHYGYRSIEEIIIDPAKLPEGWRIQGNRFSTLLEAVIFLHDIGILGFSGVVKLSDDTFGAAVPITTDEARRAGRYKRKRRRKR